MEWNGPSPAALIGESLEERGSLLRRTWCVNLCVLPVRPVSLVLQSLVELAVLQVLGRDDAVALAAVDDIIEPDGATSAICLAAPRRRLGPPRVGNLRVGREVVDRLKFDRVDLDTLIRASSRFLSVVEHQLVRLGPDHIPGVAVRAVGRQKVCVAGALTVQLERRAILSSSLGPLLTSNRPIQSQLTFRLNPCALNVFCRSMKRRKWRIDANIDSPT